MSISEHNKIINKVARTVFKEYDITRQGQSRTWIDDWYWFTTIVEFQPSKSAKGTFLNVGVCFNWYKQDYLSFDIGYREAGFCEYKNESQFEVALLELAQLALKKALFYREKFADLLVAKDTILNHDFECDNIWVNYHKAVILELCGESRKAKEHFDLILKSDLEWDWALELKNQVENLKIKLDNTSEFKNTINEIIKSSRVAKKLKEIEAKTIW